MVAGIAPMVLTNLKEEELKKNKMDFKQQIQQGIANELPEFKALDTTVSHAPKRKDILTAEEKKLALKNALRYFDAKHHPILIKEFKEELETYGRIYMYRFRPDYKIYARPVFLC